MTTAKKYNHEKGFDYVIDWSNSGSMINSLDYQKRTILKNELIDNALDIELYTVYYVDFHGNVHQVNPCKNVYDKCTISNALVNKYIK